MSCGVVGVFNVCACVHVRTLPVDLLCGLLDSQPEPSPSLDGIVAAMAEAWKCYGKKE